MRAITHVTIPIADLAKLEKFCALNEKQRRGMYGFIANLIGYGGLSAVSHELGAARATVRQGCLEFLAEQAALEASDKPDQPSSSIGDKEKGEVTPPPKDRIRRKGGGRQTAAIKQPGLVEALSELVEGPTYGDPMRVLVWTGLSTRKISKLLEAKGFHVSHTTVGEMLEDLGYSKQCNQKMLQVGTPHPDRDEQFQFIENKCKEFMKDGLPVISIDCKKKENLGNYKNPGKEYRKKRDPRKVEDHDFCNVKVAPYGIYLLNKNTGFVNLGTSCDTAQFAGESIARWWHYIGAPSFPSKNKLFITCDGGGSNGVRIRLWKWVLAELAERFNLEIHVSHFPPGTSKWNKIEHRLFCYITRNWEGKPLTDIQTVVKLIGSTTTETGLKVSCQVDENEYARGIKISDEEFAKIDMEEIGELHGWNYIVRGFKS